MPDDHPPTPKKFLTNQGENTLSRRLEKILPLTRDFDCLVGYFFISGFFRLYPALESVKKVRILIGLKNEQVVHGLIQIANSGADESTPSTAEIKSTFGGMMKKELDQAQDTLAIETGVRKFIEWIRSGKLEVKLYREQNIHAKVYIMTPEQPVESVNHGYVITGSSNFSHSGLEGNLEFNVLLAEPEEHDYALHRFNELWKNAIDVKDVHETILEVVEKESPFAFVTPYELYLKFLAEYFRDHLGDRSRLHAENLPATFKKLEYQEDAVFTAQQMLKTFGGVFISDVVGLGKTYISALLALQLDGRCLVIAPPSLLDENSAGSWPRVFRDFCVPGHKCVSIGKLEEVLEQGVEFYKYVFIDESHRFKGDATQRYELLTSICQNKGVILVSATPYNNALRDIFSQLKLFQPPRNSSIPGLRNLEAFFEKLEKRLKGLHRVDDAEQYAAVAEENAKELRERVLKYIMVRRTRREIEEYYGADLKKQKIIFPKVADPHPLFYKLKRTEADVFSNTLGRITSADFHYARYQPLNPLYYTGSIEEAAVQGQRNLATFMKILLVKRLESSFFAFQETLKRFIKSHELVLQAFDEGAVYTSKKHSRKILEFLEEGDDDAIDQLIQAEKAERYDAEKFHPLFREHVEADLETLKLIRDDWAGIKRDPKWIEFRRVLQTLPAFTKGKLIIFTEFADTATYLAERIKKEVESGTLLFSSASSPELRRQVIANFDANCRDPQDDFRILVTTDVLAEGVNLHRSAVVINYDIPWNPSRLMQRVGRVNRVGTKFKSVSTFNFFPTDEGNDEIALVKAAKAKIAAFISLLGNDARLLTGDENVTSHNLFDRINSKEAAEGDELEMKSELKYLRQILDVKEKQPELFQRILALPRKARSTNFHFFDPEEPIGHVPGGNLPHWRQEGTTYFVTFRTADSMPKERVERWLAEREKWINDHPEPHSVDVRREYHRLFSERWEAWLDESHGACHLAKPQIKQLVEDALRHFHGDRYLLDEFVVMPNHVHALVTPLAEHTLSNIVQNWKSFTSHAINKTLGLKGSFWQKESFDHIVRSPEHLERIRKYIRQNPMSVAAASPPLSSGMQSGGTPLLLTYFRQGRLDKFFRARGGTDLAEELDFFSTAEILETTPKEKRGEIDAEQFYPLLDKNKTAFTAATTPAVETLLPATAAGSGNEAIVLKRLRAKDVRTCDQFTPQDRKFIAAVHQIIAEGRVGKATIKKVKDAFDKTADPVEMLAILRRDIARQYLVAVPQKRAAEEPAAPREVILSSYLP